MLSLILSHTATAAFLFSFLLPVLCDNQIYAGGNDSGGLATKCDLTLNFTTVSVATTCGTYLMPDGDPLYCLSIKSLDPSNSVEVYSDSACTLDAVVFNSIGDYDTHGTKACLVVQCTKTASQPATSFVNITGTTDYTPTEFDPDPDPDPERDFVDNLPQPQTLLAMSHICALSSNSTSSTHTTSASSMTSTTSTPLSSTKTTSSVESITKSASSSISTSAQGKPSPEPVPDDGPGDAGGLGLDGIGLPIGGALAGANAADIAASAAANAAISVETIIHLTDSDFSNTSSLLFSASNQTDYDIGPNESVSLPTVLLPGVNGTNDTLFWAFGTPVDGGVFTQLLSQMQEDYDAGKVPTPTAPYVATVSSLQFAYNIVTVAGDLRGVDDFAAVMALAQWWRYDGGHNLMTGLVSSGVMETIYANCTVRSV